MKCGWLFVFLLPLLLPLLPQFLIFRLHTLFSIYLIPTLGQYTGLKGRWGRSVQIRGHSNPLKNVTSQSFFTERMNIQLISAKYGTDILYEIPVSIKVTLEVIPVHVGQDQMAIFMNFCIFLLISVT